MRIGTLLMVVSIMSTMLSSGCDRGYSKDEVERAVSPDGQFEAVVYETNGGATTSFGYEVDLRKVGDTRAVDVAEIYGALRNQGAYGVNVRWADPDTLHVQYLRAKSVVSSKPDATFDGKQIAVSLDAGINDPSAPGNGMLRNLGKK